jgi:hypothetical protein
MLTLSIQKSVTRFVEAGALAEQLPELRAAVGSRLARRMSPLSLLLSQVVGELFLAEGTVDCPVYYVTHYSETRALETYLRSFPTLSPAAFQGSIHPSGIQQAMIARKQSLQTLIPLVAPQTCLAASLAPVFDDPAPEIILLCGEEEGTWLAEHEAASTTTFAAGLRLSREPSGRSLVFEPRDDQPRAEASEEPEALLAFVRALQSGERWCLSDAGARLELSRKSA